MEYVADRMEYVADRMEYVADRMEYVADRMEYVADRRCRENKTHILCSIFFFSKLVPFMLYNVKERD